MISVIGIFLYMLITCYLLGFGCYELLAWIPEKAGERVSQGTASDMVRCVYAGVAFTVFYAQMFSVFYKVGLLANLSR